MTDAVIEAPPAVARRRGSRPWRVFRQNRGASLGLIVIGVIVIGVIIGPEISPYPVVEPDIANRLQPPSLAHPMGTDELGRDMLTRILAGGRLSLFVGLAATLIAMTIGITVGALAGYLGGKVDNVLMRLVDVALLLPDLFLLILASALLGPSVGTMIAVIALVRWMSTARLVRASFMSLREREFIESARAAGARGPRIVLRHLLPNSLSPVTVAATLLVASAIIAESTLSFLGLGIQPPATSWGSLLRNAQGQIFTSPWLAVFPGLMIFLTVIAINMVGDGIRDALDPGSTRTFRGRRDLIRATLLREPEVTNASFQAPRSGPERDAPR
ncbi:MAG: ABC transporter permease [Chloroflexota bacterium]